MSETVMFHDEGDTRPVHDGSVGYGVTLTVTPSNSGYLLEEVRARKGEQRTDPDDVPNHQRRGAGAYLSFYSNELAAAVSTTVGLGLAGGDTTVKLYRRNFLTVVGGGGGAQLILQHRAYNGPSAGAAVGLSYRHDIHQYITGEESILAPPSGVLPVRSFGARAMGLLRPPNGERNGILRASFYAGYAPAYEQPVVTVSFSLGRF